MKQIKAEPANSPHHRQPTDGDSDCISTLVSHYEHSGLLRELGLLFYIRWHFWSRSVPISFWWHHDHQSLWIIEASL